MEHWLLVTAWPIIEKSTLGTTTGFLVGRVLLTRLRKEWQEHIRTQHTIADRLDTSTPGGLGDLVKRDDGLHHTGAATDSAASS